MHDGIEVEKRGVPAAVVVTDQFDKTGQAIARMRGLEGYPYVIVTHPIGSLDKDTLVKRAEQALPQVVKILLEQSK